MDLKALIAKMDQIESKKILNEGFPTVADAKARADKEKTTGKFDKKELSTGTQYTRKSSTFDDGGKDKDQKKAEKKKKDEGIDFQSSIAQALVEEFGYELDERITINPDGTTSGKVAPPPAAAAPAVKNPYQGADAAKFAAMSPADQAWLTKGGGQPDINDQFILARAPNKGAAVAAPSVMKPAPVAPAAAPGVKVDPADLDRADQEMGAAMTGNAAQAAAIKSGSQDDVTGVDKAVADQAAAPATPAAAAKPKIMAKPDPAVMKIQQDLIAKGAKIKADGVMGPQTRTAMKQFGGDQLAAAPTGATPATGGSAPAAGSAAPAAKPSSAGLDASGRATAATDTRIPGNKAATATAAAPAAYNPAKDSQAANTAAPATSATAAAPTGSNTTTSNQTVSGTLKMGKPDGPIQFNGKTVNPGEPDYAAASQALIASKSKMQGSAQARANALGAKAAATGAPVTMGAANTDKTTYENVRYEDDEILNRIRTAFRF